MEDKIKFLQNLGYTVEDRTFIDWEHETRSSEAWEEPYIAKVAFKEIPDKRYEDGKHLQKSDYSALYNTINFQYVYEKEYKRVLDKIVHSHGLL